MIFSTFLAREIMLRVRARRIIFFPSTDRNIRFRSTRRLSRTQDGSREKSAAFSLSVRNLPSNEVDRSSGIERDVASPGIVVTLPWILAHLGSMSPLINYADDDWKQSVFQRCASCILPVPVQSGNKLKFWSRSDAHAAPGSRWTRPLVNGDLFR